MGGQYIFSGTGRHGRRGRDLCSEGLHDTTTIGLLFITDFHRHIQIRLSGYAQSQDGYTCSYHTPCHCPGISHRSTCHRSIRGCKGNRHHPPVPHEGCVHISIGLVQSLLIRHLCEIFRLRKLLCFHYGYFRRYDML